MLIGDAGYPALPFLLTPISNPVSDEEIRFKFFSILIRKNVVITKIKFILDIFLL